MIEILAKLGNLPGALPGACAQGIIWGIMAIGVYITYRILDVADLTVDGSMGTGGAVCIMLLLSGHNVWFALFMALVAGLLTGLVTGLFHTFMGIPAILAGILTQLSLYSINLKIMGKANQSINVDKNGVLISLRWVKEFALRNPLVMVGIITVVLIGIMYWFFGTEYGMAIRATGCNSNLSKAEGINTKRTTIVTLVISNGLVGLSGALLAQYQGFADVNMGRGAIVIGLASVIIGMVLGEVILRKHFNFIAKLSFTSLGAIIYFVVLRIVMLIGLSTDNTKLFSAVIVAVFLAVPYLQKQSRASFAKAGKRSEESLGAGKESV